METNNKKYILITGGAGFIGSHLCKKYLDEGHRVVCVDNLQTTFTTKNVDEFMNNPNFTFVKHDVTEPFRVNGRVDWIFNLACSGSYTSYQYDPVHTMKTNTVGMMNVLNLAREKGARVLQTSTSEIYGDPLEVPQPESYRGNVNVLGPRACYDEGKRAAETLCMDYHREYGVQVRIVRIFNTYGPNMDPNDGRAITNFVMKALAGDDLEIFGDGHQTRSFQFIDDLVRGIDTLMRTDDVTGPYNMGNPEREIEMIDFAKLVIELTNSSSSIVYKEGASDDPRRRKPDITKARAELLWEPRVTLREGLIKTIEYFKTVARPEEKVLVFTTTYHPVEGPAERALHELSKELNGTQFHIVTSRYKKGIPHYEEIDGDEVHRIGYGRTFDKFLLPILGVLKARKMAKQHNYRFVWAVTGTYAGISSLLYKLFSPSALFMVTLDSEERLYRKGGIASLVKPLYSAVLSRADSVYVSDLKDERNAKLAQDVYVIEKTHSPYDFAREVRFRYGALVNEQEKKLERPK